MKTRRPVLMATLLVLLANNPILAQDETLGRLFYTARQRAALDANIRSINKKLDKPTPIPPSVILNGIVTRSDGERTVWIDGRAYHRADTGDVRVTTRSANPGTAELEVGGVPQRLPVRVGQRLDPVSGETLEAYEFTPPPAKERRPQPAAADTGAKPASYPARE